MVPPDLFGGLNPLDVDGHQIRRTYGRADRTEHQTQRMTTRFVLNSDHTAPSVSILL